jgi:protein TonB
MRVHASPVYFSQPNCKNMKSEQFLTADLLDILFENRNKAYGAYSIRRAYPSHLKKAIALMLLFAGALSLLALNQPSQRNTEPLADRDTLAVTLVDIVKPEKPKEQKLQERTVTAQPETRVDKPIVIVPDDKILKNPPLDRTDTTVYVPGDANKPAIGTGGNQMIQAAVGTTTIITPEPPVTDAPEEPAIYDHPDENPEFPGGLQAWTKYLQRMLRVPEDLESGDRKTVRVKFVVNASGEVTDAVITQSAGKEFDKEVIRVIGRMPKWKPGKQRGKPVASYFTQPVTFTAGEE